MAEETTIREMGGLLLRGGGGPVYLQIAHQIRTKIAQGELVPGQLLPTQQRLAEMLGVGQVTVRRALAALADEGLVRSRQGSGTLIRDPRGERAYRPTDAHPINFVFTESGDGYPFLAPIATAIKRIADTPPRLLHLGATEDNAALIADRMQLHATRGVILNSPVNLTLVTACVRLGVPYVLLFNELIDGASPCLTVDYGPGLAGALEHLVARRRRRIVLMTPEADRFSAARWSQLFVTLLRAYRLPAHGQSVIAAGYHQMQGYAATAALLNGPSRPDAIVYCSDYQALGGLRAAEERGVRVPEDLSIIGAGRLTGGDDPPAPLSTIDLRLETLAQLALDTLTRPRARLRQSVASAFVVGQTS